MGFPALSLIVKVALQASLSLLGQLKLTSMVVMLINIPSSNLLILNVLNVKLFDSLNELIDHKKGFLFPLDHAHVTRIVKDVNGAV